MTPTDFSLLRFGLFVHFGPYAALGRGEWAMNREGISREQYREMVRAFQPHAFDANAICDLALRGGMRYIVFTTMHHDGFRLYDSVLCDFNAQNYFGRDLVAEVVAAARARGLKIGLYHSLNNWMNAPDAVDALENRAAYETFIDNTHARLEELVRKFAPFDILWYDGWWPFDAAGWRAEEMNARLRAIQSDLLFNGRNGLAGDFATPENHVSAPRPYRPWEACLTLNASWGFHAGDHDWKSPWQVIEALASCAQGGGNLLLNIGPRGDGSIPEESVAILERVGAWLHQFGEAIYETDQWTFSPYEGAPDERGDWAHFGPMSAKGNDLFLFLRRWPGREFALYPLEARVQSAELLGYGPVQWTQKGERVAFTGLPPTSPDELCALLRLRCDSPPSLGGCGGLRSPRVPHPRYDPMPSDIAW